MEGGAILGHRWWGHRSPEDIQRGCPRTADAERVEAEDLHLPLGELLLFPVRFLSELEETVAQLPVKEIVDEALEILVECVVEDGEVAAVEELCLLLAQGWKTGLVSADRWRRHHDFFRECRP